MNSEVKSINPKFLNCISIFGVNFKFNDNKRTIWDISSLDEGKILKLSKEN